MKNLKVLLYSVLVWFLIVVNSRVTAKVIKNLAPDPIDAIREKRFISFLGYFQENDNTLSTVSPSVSISKGEEVSFKQSAPEIIPCFAPGDSVGYCTAMTSCLFQSFRAAPLTLYKHFCILDSGFVGICCSKDQLIKPENLITPPDDLDKDVILEENSIDDISSRENVGTNDETKGCGVRNVPYKTKIVGGVPSRIREWPWMAALMKGSGAVWNRFCGGTLITDRHVLTAAHCINGETSRQLRVRLGEYDFSDSKEVKTRDFRVIEIRKHTGFKESTRYMHDIAILKLHTSTSFNEDIWPICMPPLDDTFEEQQATVIGWGTQGFGGPVSDVLMKAELQVWKQGECEDVLKRSIPMSTVCAGEHNGRKDACQGDSGGPLMSQLPSGRWTLVGVVSWGLNCGGLNKPGLYTRVNHYLDWIVENAVF